MAKRPKPGDILEVATDGRRLIFLQYLGKHPSYGDAVLVSPAEHQCRPTTFATIFESGYATFYPAKLAVARGMATVVGHLTTDGVPSRWRRAGARVGTEVRSWIIEDGATETLKYELSSSERRLPIASIWNHEFLLERVRVQWRPEDE